jgi:hypothetical protein
MNFNKYKTWAVTALLALASVSAYASEFIYRIPVPGLQATTVSTAPTGDPYFKDVALLMHLDGNYTDVKGHNFTPTGSPIFATGEFTQGVNFASQMSYLSTPSSTDFNFGTNDFTIEAWVNQNTLAGNSLHYSIYYQGEVVATNMQLVSFEVVGNASGAATLRFLARDASTTVVDLNGGTLPYNSWAHVAVVRTGSTLNLYLNGALAATTNIGLVAIPFPSTYNVSVGARSALNAAEGGGSFPGVLDEVRVTNGYGRYAGSAYSVPTGPFLDH